MKQTTKTIWDDVISEYQDFGFRIELPEEFLLELFFKDKKIATFYRDKVTPAVLREGCKNYLASISKEY